MTAARARELLARWLGSPASILVLAAVLRLGFTLTKQNRYYFADTAEYEAYALRILHHEPVSNLPRAPLFPAILALGFLIGGVKNYAVARLVELPIGIALVWVVMRITAFVADRRAMLLAGLMAAVMPTLVFTSSMLYPTSAYTFLLACLTLAALECGERPRLRGGVVLGLVFSLAWFTDRAVAVPAVPLGLWLLSRGREHGAAIAKVLVAAAVVTALAAIPWRLAAGGGNVAGVETFSHKAQFVLWYARMDSSLNAHRMVKLAPGESFVALPSMQFVRHEWGLLASQPAAYAHDVAWEFFHFFQPLPDRISTQNQYNRPLVLWVGAVSFTPVLVLFLIGLLAGQVRLRHRIVLALSVTSTAFFHAFFFTQTRYRVPVLPEMIVLAAIPLARLLPGRAPPSS
jgi:hypothetical protein